MPEDEGAYDMKADRVGMDLVERTFPVPPPNTTITNFPDLRTNPWGVIDVPQIWGPGTSNIPSVTATDLVTRISHISEQERQQFKQTLELVESLQAQMKELKERIIDLERQVNQGVIL